MMNVRSAILLAVALAACDKKAAKQPSTPPSDVAPQQEGDDPKPGAETEVTGPPLEKQPPNVPEFKPAFANQTRAPSLRSPFTLDVREIASGLVQPWAIAFLPDGRMLVTEKPTGKLLIVAPDGQKSPPVSGVPPVDGRDQGGLLDVEIAPDYAQSSLIYWTYYEPRKGGNGLAVARGKLTANEAPKLDDVEIIFRMQPTLDSTKHAGGRLVFTPDGKLFVTLGERSILEGRVQARDLGSHLGKIVRIYPDGGVPEDNPYVGRQGAKPEIWTSGHRNVLSAALDERGRLWEVEMGPKGGDELNLIEKGKDYGWPTIGYGEEYSGARIHEKTQQEGLEQPVYYWDPVISPSGMTIYKGNMFPEWKGNVFIGGLSSRVLIRLALENDRVRGEEHLLSDLGARIREVVEGPDGALYVLTDDRNGKLYKLTR